MKRATILSSIFPRLGFHFYTRAELIQSHPGMANLLPYGSRVRLGGGDKKVFFQSFVPTFSIGNLSIKTHLVYEEIPDDSPDLTKKVNPKPTHVTCRHCSGTVNEIVCPACGNKTTLEPIGDEVRSQGSCNITVLYKPANEANLKPFAAAEDEDQLSVADYANKMINSGIREFNFILTINLSESLCENFPGESPTERQIRLARRQEIVALELITVYRHYIQKIQGLVATAAKVNKAVNPTGEIIFRYLRYIDSFNKVPGGKANDVYDTLHSTWEDLARLVCTFPTLEHGIAEFWKKHPKSTTQSLQLFLNSAVKGDPCPLHPLIEFLRGEYRMSDDIAFKKLLEYFMYEAIPCL